MILLENANVSFLNVATFQHLKLCNVTKFLTFGNYAIRHIFGTRDVAMPILPQIIGETFPSKSGNFSTRGELFKKLGFIRLAIHFLTVRSRFVLMPAFDYIALNCYSICQFLFVRSEFNSQCRLFGSRASFGLQGL